jgi:hypothetical protein
VFVNLLIDEHRLILFITLALVLLSAFPLIDVNATSQISAKVLVVGGGGTAINGAGSGSGGGGAGGYRYNATFTILEGTYPVTVGALDGSSFFDNINSTAGGQSGKGRFGGTDATDGKSGGSGGGGGSSNGSGHVGTGGAGNTPSTSPSQGNNGGAGTSGVTTGGGGGSGGAGGQPTAGAGTNNSITGTSLTYAVGGAGTTNFANGGHGQGCQSTSGCVIISYLTADASGYDITGGTITSSGSYTIHTFTTSGTFTITFNPTPSAPLNPTLTDMTTHNATATWDAPSDGINLTGYKVWINGAVYQNDTGNTNTSLPITGLTSGTLQTLVVAGYNATGIGTNSSSATNYTINTAPVLDKVNVVNATAFKLFYTINGTFNGIRVDFEQFGSSLATVVSNSTSSAVTLIVNGTTSAVDTIVSIFAHNLGGTSAISNYITNATGNPEVPVLTSTAQTSSTITLAMASNNTGSTYDIYKSPSGCASFVSLVNGTTTPYVANSLTASTEYCFEAFSVNAYGNSTNSNLLNVTTSATTSSSSSGGGTATSNQQLPKTGLLNLSLLGNTHIMTVSDFTNGKLPVSWDSGDNIRIDSVTFDDSTLDSIKFVIEDQLPIILKGSGEAFSSNDISYSITTPEFICDPQNQDAKKRIVTNCMEQKIYEIPLTITAVSKGKTIVQTALVTIDTRTGVGGQTLALMSVFIMTFVAGFGIYGIAKHKGIGKTRNPRNHISGNSNSKPRKHIK